jgi:hypothetical protein
MQNRPPTGRNTDPETERASQNTAIATAIIVALSSLNLSAYFYMISSEALLHSLTAVGQYIIFPFAALTSTLYAVAAWRTALLHKNRKHLLVRAIAETIGAAAIITSVALTMIYGIGTSIIGPAVLASFLGAKTVYQAASAIFFGIRATQTNNPAKKAEYRDKAKYAIYSTLAGAMTTAAVIAVDIFLKPVVSILGILAGAFAAAYSILKVVDIRLKAKSRADYAAFVAAHEIEMVELGQQRRLSTTAQLTVAMPAQQQENSLESADEESHQHVDEYGFEMVELDEMSVATAQFRSTTASKESHAQTEVDNTYEMQSISL